MRAGIAALCLLGLLGLSHQARGAESPWPTDDWSKALPSEVGVDAARLAEAREYALRGDGSGCVIRHGRQILAWGDQKRRYDLKSSTKSFGATVLGLALWDGKVRLDDQAKRYHPAFGVPPAENGQTGWTDKITLRMLASQTAGFEKPGGFGRLLFEPGTRWHYSDGGPNWLAECLTLVYRQDLSELLFDRVLAPIGVTRDDLRWRDNSYRPHELEGIPRREFGSGIIANVAAMSRFGYLYLRGGRWRDREILTPGFVGMVGHTPPEQARLPVWVTAERPEGFDHASAHYGLLWWNNNDGTLPGVPRDAFWTWGLYDSLIVVIPSLDMVVARAGNALPRTKNMGHYEVLQPLLGPIAAAINDRPPPATAAGGRTTSPIDAPARTANGAIPYPPSPVIAEMRWAPKETVLRRAQGSDNWPLTWADDDALYGAYGDGNGFEPFTREKLSMGFARITGGPGDFLGSNLRTPSGESRGEGAAGKKASGLLCVDGVLYLLARNAGNAQLAWSADHGVTWTWADWKFTTGFGCPTFLNFGRDYAGARDGFVYLYSHDADSAYQPADGMVLARVDKDEVRNRRAYEFLARVGGDGEPVWTEDIADRGAVFRHAHRCWRSGITYNAAIGRYLWVQILPDSRHPRGPRFQGGLAVYDAPQPWGPWTTAFFSEEWDVGPGETASFPTKWMSADGRTLHLVFSGNDSFSVRACSVVLCGDKVPGE